MASSPPSFPTSPEVSTALLLATLPNLSTPHFLAPVITTATTQTHDRLIIILFSRCFNVPAEQPLTLEHSSDHDSEPNFQRAPSRSNPNNEPEQPATTTLYLQPSPSFPPTLAVSHTSSFPSIQRLLTFIYVQATKTAQEMGKVLMSIDVILKGLNEPVDSTLGEGMEICFRVSGDSIPVPLPSTISSLRQSYLHPGDRQPDFRIFSEEPSRVQSPLPETTTHAYVPSILTKVNPISNRGKQLNHEPDFQKYNDNTGNVKGNEKEFQSHSQSENQPKPSTYPVVALGGTFDHLHAGHKILLSMGAWIAHRKVIVGVTDPSLLRSKSNASLIQSLPVRIAHVNSFLRLFKPSLEELEIVPITDVYGPTGWDADVQGLVVSKETKGGAAMIATHRKSKHLPPLDVYVIDVISSTHESLEEGDEAWLRKMKLSSTFIREWVRESREGKDGKEDEKSAGVGNVV